MSSPSGWLFWAILSALFAALTAILAKVGIRGMDSDFATLIRTFVVAVLLPSSCDRTPFPALKTIFG